MNIIDDLRKYIVIELATEVSSNIHSLSEEDDLLSQGLIDSMGILKLVSFIEEKFNFKVKDEDIVPENFKNLSALKVFIERNQK